MPTSPTLNRLPYTSPPFDIRGEDVKWPTLRGAYLNEITVSRLRVEAITFGKSIVFLEGMYKTNLNQWTNPPRSPIEKAVFFEWFIRSPSPHKGGIFFLCWIGNFHNGSIFHCAPQYPQVQAWQDALGTAWLDSRAVRIYRRIATVMYGNGSPGGESVDMDDEVKAFLAHASHMAKRSPLTGA